MKKLITIILISTFLLSGCSQEKPLGAATDTSIISDIKTEQAVKLSTIGKYQHQPLTKIGNYEKLVDEYLTPKGERGYWIYLYEERADGRYLKIDGVGVLTNELKKDWTKIIDYTASSTPK